MESDCFENFNFLGYLINQELIEIEENKLEFESD